MSGYGMGAENKVSGRVYAATKLRAEAAEAKLEHTIKGLMTRNVRINNLETEIAQLKAKITSDEKYWRLSHGSR